MVTKAIKTFAFEKLYILSIHSLSMATTDEYVRKLGKAVNEFSDAYGKVARYIGPMKGLEMQAEAIEKANKNLETQVEKMKKIIEKIKDDRQKLMYQRKIEEFDRLKSANDHKLTDIRTRIAVWAGPVESHKRQMNMALTDITAYAEKIEHSLD